MKTTLFKVIIKNMDRVESYRVYALNAKDALEIVRGEIDFDDPCAKAVPA